MTEQPLPSLIRRALKDLDYGHVQLVVHEGKLVRIERVEKIRVPTGETGGSSIPLDCPTPSREERRSEGEVK